MAYIQINESLNGIRGLMDYSPETAAPINQLAEILLRPNHSSLSRGERELIATFVSHLNDCFFCQNAHGAIAQHYLACDMQFIDQVKADYQNMPIADKLKSLLAIAASVQKGGRYVTPEQIDNAKKLGVSDREIHDTVLIAAYFCMCNRYVDGLGTSAIQDRNYYINRGEMRANEGYAGFDLHK